MRYIRGVGQKCHEVIELRRSQLVIKNTREQKQGGVIAAARADGSK